MYGAAGALYVIHISFAGHRPLCGAGLPRGGIQLAGTGDLRNHDLADGAVHFPRDSGGDGLKFAMRRANFILFS